MSSKFYIGDRVYCDNGINPRKTGIIVEIDRSRTDTDRTFAEDNDYYKLCNMIIMLNSWFMSIIYAKYDDEENKR